MTTPVDLDRMCGRYLTLRQLVECGETWHECAREGLGIANVPEQRESIAALEALCADLLDPLIDSVRTIEITYAFSGPELASQVRRRVGRVAPALDQHAAHEVNSRGDPVCRRGGAAVDLYVPGHSSLEIGKWIVSHTRFDRLYYYGAQAPIHVSVSEVPAVQVVEMKTSRSGRRTPIVTGLDEFLRRSVARER